MRYIVKDKLYLDYIVFDTSHPAREEKISYSELCKMVLRNKNEFGNVSISEDNQLKIKSFRILSCNSLYWLHNRLIISDNDSVFGLYEKIFGDVVVSVNLHVACPRTRELDVSKYSVSKTKLKRKILFNEISSVEVDVLRSSIYDLSKVTDGIRTSLILPYNSGIYSYFHYEVDRVYRDLVNKNEAIDIINSNYVANAVLKDGDIEISDYFSNPINDKVKSDKFSVDMKFFNDGYYYIQLCDSKTGIRYDKKAERQV